MTLVVGSVVVAAVWAAAIRFGTSVARRGRRGLGFGIAASPAVSSVAK